MLRCSATSELFCVASDGAHACATEDEVTKTGGWGGMQWMGRAGILYDGACIFIHLAPLVSDRFWEGHVVGAPLPCLCQSCRECPPSIEESDHPRSYR